jgi:AraC-like DNA-binding protein
MKQMVLWHDVEAGDPGEFAFRALGLHEAMGPGLVQRPKGWEGYLFMLFHRPVRLLTAEGMADHPANSLMVWAPQDPELYGHPAEPWSHSWLYCAGRLVARSLEDGGLRHNRPVARAQPATMEWYLEAMLREIAANAAPDWRVLANHVHNLAIELGRDSRRGRGAREVPAPLLQARALLAQDYSRPHRLADLARAASLSVSHFSHLFRKSFGVPPAAYLRQQRLQHAARLLGDRSLRIGEIARRTGYTDIYHFSRMFRRHFGTSPTAMRRRL